MKKLLLLFVCVLSINTSFSLTKNSIENVTIHYQANNLTNGITSLIFNGIKAIKNKWSNNKKDYVITSNQAAKLSQTLAANKTTTALSTSNMASFTASMFFADVTGDFRSKGVGPAPWDSASSWEVYNGSTWVNATSYPGQSAGTYSVTIQTGHTITITKIFQHLTRWVM